MLLHANVEPAVPDLSIDYLRMVCKETANRHLHLQDTSSLFSCPELDSDITLSFKVRQCLRPVRHRDKTVMTMNDLE